MPPTSLKYARGKNMKRIASTFALGACLLAGAVAAQAENRALIIGIGQAYQEFGIKPIAGPERDVELAQELAGTLGFSSSEIKVLKEKEATYNNMVSGFEWVRDGVKDGGKALIYYSGHGHQIPDESGDEDDSCDEVLVPVDATKTTTPRFFVDDDIDRYLSAMRNAEVLFIADSCFSGTITKSFAEPQNTKVFKYLSKSTDAPRCGKARNSKGLASMVDKAEILNNLVVLSATAPNEVAYGDLSGTGKGSLLTQALYDTVKERGSTVTFRELRDSAADSIRLASEAKNYIPHTPQLDGNVELFARSLKLQQANSNYQGGTDAAVNNAELFERIVRNSKFGVAIVTSKRELNLKERISFTVTSSEDGYLNIIDIDADNSPTVLFPNKFAETNQVNANKELRVPMDIGGFKLVATTRGKSTVVAIVTKEPLNLYKENIGKTVGQFKSFGSNDFSRLKQTVIKRTGKGIGVEKEDKNEHVYGATSIPITVN